MNRIVVLNHLAMDWTVLPATYHDVRFGGKFIFAAKTEIFEVGEGLNTSNGSSTHKLSIFCLFHKHL
jgi:hypothetical protein